MRAPGSSRRRRSSGRSSPVLPACSSVPPLVLRRSLEGGEGLVPELVEVGAEVRHAVRIDAVDPPCAVSTLGHQPGFLQDPKVLRDGGAADWQLVRNLADRARAFAKLLEDRPASAVAKCVNWVLVSHDLRKSRLTLRRCQLAPELELVPRGRGRELEQSPRAARFEVREVRSTIIPGDIQPAVLDPVVEPCAPEDELAQPVDERLAVDQREPLPVAHEVAAELAAGLLDHPVGGQLDEVFRLLLVELVVVDDPELEGGRGDALREVGGVEAEAETEELDHDVIAGRVVLDVHAWRIALYAGLTCLRSRHRRAGVAHGVALRHQARASRSPCARARGRRRRGRGAGGPLDEDRLGVAAAPGAPLADRCARGRRPRRACRTFVARSQAAARIAPSGGLRTVGCPCRRSPGSCAVTRLAPKWTLLQRSSSSARSLRARLFGAATATLSAPARSSTRSFRSTTRFSSATCERRSRPSV